MTDHKLSSSSIGFVIPVLPNMIMKNCKISHKRERLSSLVAFPKVKNPILLSGDGHIDEIIKLEDDRFPLAPYEITLRGLHTAKLLSERKETFIELVI